LNPAHDRESGASKRPPLPDSRGRGRTAPEPRSALPGSDAREDARDVVLLGASNLTMALPQALEALERRFPDEMIVARVAHGPGRSFGLDAGLPGLRFRGHRESSLLQDIERRDRTLPLSALITDIGNDILYDVEPLRLLEWVREITVRIQSTGGDVVLTSLPLETVRRIPAWKYRCLRTVYFPGSRLPLAETLARVEAVTTGLEDVCRETGARLLASNSEWYGFDHFHLRLSRRRDAFRAWISEFAPGPRSQRENALDPSKSAVSSGENEPTRRGVSAWGRAWLRFRRPERLFVLGKELRRVPLPTYELGPRLRLRLF
jgi:hypothetical protein